MTIPVDVSFVTDLTLEECVSPACQDAWVALATRLDNESQNS